MFNPQLQNEITFQPFLKSPDMIISFLPQFFSLALLWAKYSQKILKRLPLFYPFYLSSDGPSSQSHPLYSLQQHHIFCWWSFWIKASYITCSMPSFIFFLSLSIYLLSSSLQKNVSTMKGGLLSVFIVVFSLSTLWYRNRAHC